MTRIAAICGAPAGTLTWNDKWLIFTPQDHVPLIAGRESFVDCVGVGVGVGDGGGGGGGVEDRVGVGVGRLVERVGVGAGEDELGRGGGGGGGGPNVSCVRTELGCVEANDDANVDGVGCGVGDIERDGSARGLRDSRAPSTLVCGRGDGGRDSDWRKPM